MKAKLKLWAVRLLPLLTLLGAGVAVKQHVAMNQPGAYAVGGDINGVPLSEIVGYITAIIGAAGSVVALWKKPGADQGEVKSEAQATEESHLSALNSQYFTESDWEAMDKLKHLRVHRAAKHTDPQPTPVPKAQ